MSIFDTVKGMMGGAAGGDAGLLTHAMDLVNSPDVGGVQGLVEKFHSNGMGDIVSSWVGQGANKAISPEQVQQVLGNDKIAAMASKFGISPDEASAKLSQYLPAVIDKLTPGGTVPAANG